jgi:hypothetical protein
MATSWYLCPYDSAKLGPRLVRRPAMHRYYPVIPNAEEVVWEEAETLGNHCIVKVIGPDSAHATIRADASFFEFNPLSTIPSNRRNQVRNRLTSLGFTQAEVDATGFVITQLLALLTTAAAIIGPDATGNAVEAKPGRKVAPKTVAQIEANLPG